MRSYIYLVFILGIMGLMSSCFEDEGNYTYVELPDFYVDTIGQQTSFTIPQFSDISLESHLVYAGDKSVLDFTWSIYAATTYGSNVADTLARTENMTATIDRVPGDYIIEFCAMETATGLRTTMRYNITIESVVGTGLLVYYQQDGQADCDMVRSRLFNGSLTESTVSRNLYSLANPDHPLTGKPSTMGITSGYWMYLFTNTELVRLSLIDMTLLGEFEDLFLTVPEVCKPQGYYRFNTLELLINDNKLYTLLLSYGGSQYPLARTIAESDYSASPYAMIGWGVCATIYDELHQRFLFGDTYSSELTEIPNAEGSAFDMGNVGKDLLYMASGYCDQEYALYPYAVMETPGVPAERSVYVYTTAASASGESGYAVLDLAGCANIADATLWAFSTRSPSMYYTTGASVYTVNFSLSGQTVVPPTQPSWTCPAGEHITCMRMFSDEGLNLDENASCKYLMIATYNGTEGKIYILEADVASGVLNAEPVESFDGFGEIKDMQFKNQ